MIGSSLYARRSGFDFLPVFEGKADVVFAVDSGEVHQAVPEIQCEFCQLIRQLFKGLEEGFVVGPLRLPLLDFLRDSLKPGLCFLEALRQGIVSFLIHKYAVLRGRWFLGCEL